MGGRLALSAVVSLLLVAGAARGDETPSFGVTETLLVERHGFNQDRRDDNDDYWDFKSRLNLTATGGPYTATLRLDDIVYLSPPDASYDDDHRIERVSLRADGRFVTVT